VIEQFAGGAGAVHDSVVPVCVVPEADSPVGAPGDAEQVPVVDPVVDPVVVPVVELQVPTSDQSAGTSTGSHPASDVCACMHLYSDPL